MATEVRERKRYSEEEKQKHLGATAGMSHTEQVAYCEKENISVNTLRSWRRAKEGTTSAKGSGRGRKKAAGGKKKAAKKPGPKPGKRRGRPPGSKNQSKEVVAPKAGGSVKQRVKDKLFEDFENQLAGGEGTLDGEMRQLLTDVHNTL